MTDNLFKDRVRERDLDNFLIEELHVSTGFLAWLLARLEGRFEAPPACKVRLAKSPARLQDARQTDVQVGWFDAGGAIQARVLIESKVGADFQPGQVEAYVAEVAAARAMHGIERAATVLVAPSARLTSLAGADAFDARVSIEEVADTLEARRDGTLPPEIDARLSVRVQLLEALCGRRQASIWIGMTVPEKRDFADAYAALARERLPGLQVRPSNDGPKALTRIFEGLTLPGLPTPALRHEYGRKIPWKWVNAQFAGMVDRLGDVRASGVLSGSPYSAEAAGGSLAIRVATPGIDPERPFNTQRDAVIEGLDAVGALAAWLEENAGRLTEVLTPAAAAAPDDPGTTHRDAAVFEREFAVALRDIYDQCAKLDYHPTGMLGMIERLGGVETARQLLRQPGTSEGFAKLALLGRIDLAVESLVLQPRWKGVFSDEELRIAKRRLRV